MAKRNTIELSRSVESHVDEEHAGHASFVPARAARGFCQSSTIKERSYGPPLSFNSAPGTCDHINASKGGSTM